MQQKYKELLEFFQYWVPKYGECDLYLFGQAAPRQDIPYVSVNILSSIELVGTVERRIQESGSEILRSELTLGCDLYGYTPENQRYNNVSANNAWAIIQELKTSLRYQEAYDRLSSINCRLLDEGSVIDTTQLVSTTFEPQATCSISLSTVVESITDNGAVETIEGEGTMGGTFNDINIDISVTN
jgi:hypothetical protein